MNNSVPTIPRGVFPYFPFFREIVSYEYGLLERQLVVGLRQNLYRLAPKLDIKLFIIEHSVL